MKILLFCRYTRMGASSRLRMLQYVDSLTKLGAEFEIAPLLDDDYLRATYGGKRRSVLGLVKNYVQRWRWLRRAGKFDLIWIEKELFPNLPAWFEKRLAHSPTPYVVDYDDAIFHTYDLARHPLKKLLKNKISKVMGSSAAVVAGNTYLGDYATRAGAAVTLLPTVIDIERYPSPVEHAPAPTLVIGWIGSPATVKFLTPLLPVIGRLAGLFPVQLAVIGAKLDTDRYPFISNIAWSEHTEVAEISRFDIGVMPLPDAAWERGKCAYKLIQYMACGKAVVASPVGMNVDVVQHGMSGLLATTEEEWFQALGALLSNPQLRRSMGGAGRTAVEEKYCLQVTAHRLYGLFSEVILEREKHRCAG